MENQIKNSFCNYCNNKRENCMEIEIKQKNDILTYRCINYVKKDPLPTYKKFDYTIKSDRKR